MTDPFDRVDVSEVFTMTEATFQEQVRKLAVDTGWLYYHTHDSRRSPEGYPDVHLVKPPRIIHAELKVDDPKEKPSRAQRVWLDAFAACPGVETYLWRPKDWEDINLILFDGPYETERTRWVSG
jgi:hypothetical protein